MSRSYKSTARGGLWLVTAPSIALFCTIAALAAPPGQQGKAIVDWQPRSSEEVFEQNRRCLECHGQEHISTLSPQERLTMVGTLLHGEDEAGRVRPLVDRPPLDPGMLRGNEPDVRPELYLRPDALNGSVHDQLACIDCHDDAAQLPHDYHLNLSTCASTCHKSEYDLYFDGTHAQAKAEGEPLAPDCASCHGGHQILSVGSRQSPQHRLNSIFLCAECHVRHQTDTPSGYKPAPHMQAYFESTHGKAVVESGLVAAPTCVDCHAAHEVHPVEDERSMVHRDRVPETCGSCHVGILSIYEQSVHGQLVKEHNEEAPVCTDCHMSHDIVRPDPVEFKLHSDARCGHCHEERLERYRETFHGKALHLGLEDVAACYDCHGHHDMTRVDAPDSPLVGDRKIQKCQQCHPKASGYFADYIAHADHYDKEHYPALYWTFIFMTSIVIGTFAFFGIHTLLWLVRSGALYLKDPKLFRAIKARKAADEEEFVRFRPIDRFLHVLVITSFLLLVATGMPLKFYDAAWAKTMVTWAGGLDATAQLHRFGAIITFLYFALHLGSLVTASIRNRNTFRNPETGRFSIKRFLRTFFGPDMPAPTIQDVKDFWAHQKWFFGRGPQPDFDRWTYWEKFDYLAVFWGVFAIGMSGLVMWFPEFFTKFLPGWIINVALIVHSDEALLAAGFIFTFHFFNVHFRPEKFPIDPVIFSGRISKTEMIHERKRWYDRLVREGRLESVRVRDEWGQWKRLIHPLGMLAFLIGLVLLALILYAMGLRLFGGHM